MERHLVAVRATNVLGEYNHHIEFPEDQNFAIIFGPNGIGKTRLLELIDAICTLNIGALVSIPYERVVLSFSDDFHLYANRTEVVARQRGANSKKRDSETVTLYEVVVGLTAPDGTTYRWAAGANSNFELWLQSETPWEPLHELPGRWRDRTDGQVVRLDELRAQYMSRFRIESNRASTDPIPGELLEFTKSLAVRTIETQRLTKLDTEAFTDDRYLYRNEPRPTATITQFSRQIRKTLNDTLSSNSRLTQRLDSTFPRRMLDRGDKSVLTEGEIREKWEVQTQLRARLTEIADLGVDTELSLPDNELNSWQLSMLELYLDDADKKLDSFQFVLARINLLEDIINDRLLRKRLSIDAAAGMQVHREVDGSLVSLTSLSSGEQHEVILMFELLFNVASNCLVLIDEPEISLHIGWQQKFIADVLRIASLVGFQFLVATHSPQIIDRWWGYAKELGPGGAEFLGEEY